LTGLGKKKPAVRRMTRWDVKQGGQQLTREKSKADPKGLDFGRRREGAGLLSAFVGRKGVGGTGFERPGGGGVDQKNLLAFLMGAFET